ncbi:hypothetical protein BKM03_01760 [Pseudomonas avellanae]|uniref:Uncharacterized protein n=1 Tax=Pseudomonas avellanae TaxID=46257 RepID=A0AAD0GN89_9PSED|nr:hypothetical protein BKM03_01760 [Pseudomonas avellanae]POP87866.1 hypothetical protein CXB34_04970 [Pseudomonas amygdali pv. morsprunorum]
MGVSGPKYNNSHLTALPRVRNDNLNYRVIVRHSASHAALDALRPIFSRRREDVSSSSHPEPHRPGPQSPLALQQVPQA